MNEKGKSNRNKLHIRRRRREKKIINVKERNVHRSFIVINKRNDFFIKCDDVLLF